jgi:protein translocase SecG subunit
MNYSIIFKTTQIVITVLLIGLVLIQSKGKGLASGIGNNISFYRSKRGVERFVFISTIFLSVCLVVNSLLTIIFR